jgi:MYXO-CTERM domain-containing protein
MSTDALDTVKEHLANAVDSVRDLAPGSVDDAKTQAADLAKAAIEHGQDALAGSEQAARDGADSLRNNQGRVFAVAAVLLLALAALLAGRRRRTR